MSCLGKVPYLGPGHRNAVVLRVRQGCSPGLQELTKSAAQTIALQMFELTICPQKRTSTHS